MKTIGQIHHLQTITGWKRILSRLMPSGMYFRLRALYTCLRGIHTLIIKTGMYQSAKLIKPMIAGREVPYFSYAAIAFLDTLDLSNKTVLEWGSGVSTIYWGNKACEVHSVEDNKEWLNYILPLVTDNVNIQLMTTKMNYVLLGMNNNQLYDVIVVDGIYRYECAQEAVQRVKSGGFIIVDDTDVVGVGKEAGEICENAGLIRVDMPGIATAQWEPHTTTIFFKI